MKKSSRPKIPESLRRHIASEQQWKCAHCAGLLDARFDIDHIKPLHCGGSDALRNLQALCANCHHRKTHFEVLQLHDKNKEKQTRKSRYWDPLSVDFISHHHLADVRLYFPLLPKN